MKKQDQRCWNCRFWGDPPEGVTRDPAHDAGAPEPIRGDSYECQRHPPAVVRFVHYDDGDGAFTLAEHATTAFDDWCGEWMAANPQTMDDAAVVMARAVLAGDATAGRALADRLIELVVLDPYEPIE